MPHPRLLVLDEDMPGRLAGELNKRGRTASRVSELELRGMSDPALIEWLAKNRSDCVLVTGNYWMPSEHEEAVRESPIAIATIDPRVADGYTEEAWRRDVTHRWAHLMQLQGPGTVRRYSMAGARPWAPRIRVS